MKISSLRVVTVIIAILSLSILAQAQNRERFGISAKAGGVNAVSGQVMVKRKARILNCSRAMTTSFLVTSFGPASAAKPRFS